MKKLHSFLFFKILVIALLLQSVFSINANAQLTTTRVGNYGLMPYLVNHVLLSGGVTATNITYQGIDTSFGFFNGSKSNIGMDTGLIITNGTITLADGPNCKANDKSDGGCTTYAYGSTDGWLNSSNYRDSDLANLIGTTYTNTFSCALLQFDFTANSDSVEFQYVFASNEEPYYVGSSYLDDFGFFLSGPGIAGTFSHHAVNLALIPKTSTAVYINSVNCTTNSAYYVCNWPSSTGCSSCPASTAVTTVGYNGFTTVLTAKSAVQCGQKYHIKIGLADIGNGKFDSGVFLKGGSFKPIASNMNVTPASSTICSGQNTTLTATGALSYTWSPSASLNKSTGASVVATPTVTTTYSVVGNISGACDDTLKVVVNVNPTPTVSVAITGISPSLCGGDTIGLVASGATSYTWKPSGSLSASTGAHVIANPTTTTTYTVTGTNGSCSNTASIVITVYPTPTVTVTPGAPGICPGGTANLTATGATSYVWTPTAGLSCSTCANTTASLGTTTKYYVTGTSAGGCQSTDSVTITVASTLTVSITPSSPAICSGDSVMLSANGAPSYTWGPATGLSCTNCPNPYANPASATTYTVTGISGACTAKDSVIITINPKPSINVSSTSSSVCMGNTTVLNASGGTGYIWSPATGLSTTTGASVTATPTVATTYVVTGTNASGCSGKDSITISINPTPTITISASSGGNICSGNPDTITATGAANYTWIPAGTLSSSSGSPVIATPSSTTTYTVIATSAAGCNDTANVTISVTPTPTLSVTPLNPGICSGDSVLLTVSGATNYTWSPGTSLSTTVGGNVIAFPTSSVTYTVTGINGTCTSNDTVSITVGNLVVTATASSSSICTGGSTTLTAGGAVNYTWSPATGLNISTGSPVTATPTVTTTYSLLGTSGSGNCADSTTVVITVNPTPTLSVSAGSPLICSGGSGTTVTATGATAYTWNPASGVTCSTCANTIANPASNTTFTVTGTNSFGCNSSDTISIQVDQPNFIATSSLPAICNGSNTLLNITGGVSYTWNPASSLNCNTCPSPIANPSANTTYTVVGTDAAGCPDSANVSITVNSLPVVTVVPADTSICTGNSTTLSATGANTYAWTPSTGLTCISCSSTSADPNSTSTYTVIGTSSQGCNDTVQIVLTVFVSPVISISLSGGDTLCAGQSLSMTASGGVSYTWSPSAGLGGTTTGATVTSTPTTSPITYTVIGSSATCSDSAKQTVYLYPPLQVAMTPDTICLGKQAVVGVAVTGGKPGYNYVWNNGLTNGPGPYSVSPGVPTYYVCSVTDGCNTTITDSMQVFTAPVPVAGFVATPKTILGGQFVSFVNTSTGATSYVWNIGDGSSSTDANPYYQYNIPGNYIVTLIASNRFGCTDTASDTVYVTGGIYVPNVFTPNGDGINDVFHITAGGMQTYYIEIFNRWGERVFEADSPEIDWTGRSMAGVMESDGTYYYIIKATDYANKKYNLDGYLQLIH